MMKAINYNQNLLCGRNVVSPQDIYKIIESILPIYEQLINCKDYLMLSKLKLSFFCDNFNISFIHTQICLINNVMSNDNKLSIYDAEIKLLEIPTNASSDICRSFLERDYEYLNMDDCDSIDISFPSKSVDSAVNDVNNSINRVHFFLCNWTNYTSGIEETLTDWTNERATEWGFDVEQIYRDIIDNCVMCTNEQQCCQLNCHSETYFYQVDNIFTSNQFPITNSWNSVSNSTQDKTYQQVSSTNSRLLQSHVIIIWPSKYDQYIIGLLLYLRNLNRIFGGHLEASKECKATDVHIQLELACKEAAVNVLSNWSDLIDCACVNRTDRLEYEQSCGGEMLSLLANIGVGGTSLAIHFISSTSSLTRLTDGQGALVISMLDSLQWQDTVTSCVLGNLFRPNLNATSHDSTTLTTIQELVVICVQSILRGYNLFTNDAVCLVMNNIHWWPISKEAFSLVLERHNLDWSTQFVDAITNANRKYDISKLIIGMKGVGYSDHSSPCHDLYVSVNKNYYKRYVDNVVSGDWVMYEGDGGFLWRDKIPEDGVLVQIIEAGINQVTRLFNFLLDKPVCCGIHSSCKVGDEVHVQRVNLSLQLLHRVNILLSQRHASSFPHMWVGDGKNCTADAILAECNSFYWKKFLSLFNVAKLIQFDNKSPESALIHCKYMEKSIVNTALTHNVEVEKD